MTKTETTTRNHNTYGGKIYLSDFDTYNCRGYASSRIFSDWKFDEQCKKNYESRNRKKGLKND